MNNRNIKDIKFGTTEYSKLSKEDKLIKVKLEFLQLFNDKSEKTIPFKYHGVWKTIPKSKEKFCKALIQEEKALKKKTKIDIDILEDSRNNDNIYSLFLGGSINEKATNLSVPDGDSDIVINMPKRNEKISKIYYTESDYDIVFKKFFEETSGVKKPIKNIEYKVMLEDKAIDGDKEKQPIIFDIDFDHSFETDKENEKEFLSRYKTRKEKKNLFGFMKEKLKARFETREKSFSSEAKYKGKFLKSESPIINYSNNGKFLKPKEEKPKVNAFKLKKDSILKRIKGTVNTIVNKTKEVFNSLSFGAKKGKFLKKDSSNVGYSNNGKFLKFREEKPKVNAFKLKKDIVLEKVKETVNTVVNKTKEVFNSLSFGVKKEKFFKKDSSIINYSNNGMFLNLKEESVKGLNSDKKKRKGFIKEAAVAVGLAASIFLGMFTMSGAKKGEKKATIYTEKEGTYDSYDQNERDSVETTIEDQIVYENETIESTAYAQENYAVADVQNTTISEVDNNISDDVEQEVVTAEDNKISIGQPIFICEGASIFASPYDAVNDINKFNPYFDTSYERTVMGIVYNLDGNLYIVNIYDSNYENKVQELIAAGAKEEAVLVTRTDLISSGGIEGYYSINDAVPIENNAKVRTRSR